MAENIKIVPASCTQCGGTVEVDPGADKAVCPFCGTSFIIEKAINNYNVQHATIEHADNVNIDMTGAVKSVLDFAGEQMKESRAERRQARKQFEEDGRKMKRSFFKLMSIMFIGMFVLTLIFFIYYQIVGGGEYEEEQTSISTNYYSEDNSIFCYIEEDGTLSVNITDPGEYQWYYFVDASTEPLSYDEADFDGYHFYVDPDSESGIGYAVVGQYDSEEEVTESYGVVKYVIEEKKVTEISEIVIVSDLSEYNFAQ